MAAILPLCSLLLLYIIFHQKDTCRRSSMLSAFVIWGIVLSVITEILSLGTLLTFDWLVWSWISIDLTTGYGCFLLIKNRKPTTNRKIISNRSPFSILLLCGIAFIIGIVGLVAWISPPNNWDSMVYHMSRVVHWKQNHSLANYPVSALPQLYQRPWAEFAILHLQILSGGDRFANLIQWFSMVGSIVGVSLIAKQIGADVRGQIFAAVVCATIPMGILQGSSTQNDYVVSFWLVSFIYYLLLMASGRVSLVNSIKLGGSLGLAILTKGTAYIYAVPLCVWLTIILVRYKPKKLWKHVFAISSLFILLNIGQAMRNSALFGSLLVMGEEKYTNDYFGASVFLSNIIRNLSLHLVIPSWSNIFTTSISKEIERFVNVIHLGLGIDVSDPHTTWTGTKFGITSFDSLLHEDSAGNFLHLLLIIFTIILCLTTKRIRRQKYSIVYLAIVVAMFLVFSFLLKWQPWHSRLQLPLFVLLSAFIGTVLSNLTYRKLANCIIVMTLICSLPWLLFNQSRPLISQNSIINTSRIDGYFNYRPTLREPYIGATNFIKSQDCSEVGLSVGSNEWEYPFWVLMENGKTASVRIEQIDVTNISVLKATRSMDKNFTPCALIYTNSNNIQKKITSKGTYIREWSSDPVSVFMLTQK